MAKAKGKPGANMATAKKRWRCLVCGKFGHKNEGCWLLEKRVGIQPVLLDTLLIVDKMGGSMDMETNGTLMRKKGGVV